MTTDTDAVVEGKIEEEIKKVEESNFIKDCKSLFGSSNLYEILNLTKESTINDGLKI